MTIDMIMKAVLRGLFYCETILPVIALKGGNAIKFFYERGGHRASFDLDFSMSGDFSNLEDAKNELQSNLQDAFEEDSIHMFDFKLTETPGIVSANIKSFWGGYTLEFKIIEAEKSELSLQDKQRQCIKLNGQGKIKIDFSKYEYIDGSEELDIDHITFPVYTKEMIICEKLRAICQQHPDYQPVVNRDGRGVSSRAKDFFDIHDLMSKFDVSLPGCEDLINKIFAAKKVDVKLLSKLDDVKDLHQESHGLLEKTLPSDYDLQSFEYYFAFVENIVNELDL